MSEAIVTALITGAAAVCGQWLIARKGRAEDRIERARLDQRTADRLAAIERKLDEHNGYAVRLTELSADVRELRTELRHMQKGA